MRKSVQKAKKVKGALSFLQFPVSLFARSCQLSCYAVFLLLISGCSGVSYYAQAVKGHFRVMGVRVPVSKVLANTMLSSENREKLLMVLEVREFASAELGLPRNKSYTVYSEIQNEYIGWNVYATPRLSVEPITWCFPIAGCVVYRGYFSKERAIKFAQKLEKEGDDVYVSPISAYSTLGWYNDPILSTHLRMNIINIAGLIIHELAHQQLYVKDDSRFSESFAVTVERAGVLRWLRYSGRDSLVNVAQKMWERQDLYNAKMFAARSKLIELYTSYNKHNYNHLHSYASSKYSEGQKQLMQQKKDSLLLEFSKEFGPERFGPGSFSKINNAFFVPANTYYSLVPKFQRMLDSLGGDFRKFYKEAKRCCSF